MDKKYIYLVRHGDIGLGGEKRYIGQTDLTLSSVGKKQADLLQDLFSEVPLDAIYCSDLKRARQTAEIIGSAHQIKPVVRTELRELNMGEWDGELFSDIRAKYPTEFKKRGEGIANHRPPGGESFADCSRRVVPLFETLMQSGEDKIVIVGHAGVNRIILCHTLGIPLANVFRLEQRYGCLNLIIKEGSEYRLKFLNQSV